MDDKILINVIKDNKNLIYSIINKYGNKTNFDDLYQVSIIGIIKAYRNYDKNRDVKFSTYAYKYILSEILIFLNNTKLIKTSRDYHKLCKKIMEAKNILTQKLMKEPTNYEISLFLEIDEALINDVMRYQENIKSLDEIIMDDGKNITLLDTISDNSNNMNDDIISLKEGIRKLSKEEQQFINLRYFNDKTQGEIAKFFGTNQVQVSRNEQKVLKKLKNNLCGTQ